MAISRLTASDGAGTGTAASITATFGNASPVTPTQGNLLLASGYSSGGYLGIGMSSSGWSVIAAHLEGQLSLHNLWLWYKIAGASESQTVVINSGIAASAVMRLHIFEYSGTNKTNQLNDPNNTVTNGGEAASGTTVTLNTVATINANDLLFAGVGWSGAITSNSAVFSSSALNVLTANTRMTTADLVVSSAGSYTTTCTWTTSRVSVGCIAAFTQAPTSTGGSTFILRGAG